MESVPAVLAAIAVLGVVLIVAGSPAVVSNMVAEFVRIFHLTLR